MTKKKPKLGKAAARRHQIAQRYFSDAFRDTARLPGDHEHVRLLLEECRRLLRLAKRYYQPGAVQQPNVVRITNQLRCGHQLAACWLRVKVNGELKRASK